MKRLAILLVLAALGGSAHAHAEVATGGGFLDGFLHPFTGGDHLLAMISVGMWGAVLAAPLVWALPVAFPLMMVCGALAALAGVHLPGVEAGVALSVLALGACIAVHWRAPVPVALALVGFFGFLHGYAHGHELPASASPAAYATGFVLASGSLHATGIAIGLVHAWKRGQVLVQLLGSFSGLAGLWMLAARVWAA
jgi:urease accessory protein